MTNSKKWQIAIALVLTCNFALWSAEEPNDANHPQIKIEISDQERPWLIGIQLNQFRQGSIRPTLVAEARVQTQSVPSLKAESFLKTSAAAAMTTKQREFIESTRAFILTGSSPNPTESLFRLFAVSEADARKMIEAFIEILGEKPKQKRLQYVNKLREDTEEMAKAKGLLPGKEALLLTVKAEYDKSKKLAQAFSADTEAVEHAIQTMLEMSKMLDTLDVELAGIREKLEVIRTYWSQHRGRTNEADAKLEEIQIIQTIELKGAEARRKAAVAIRQREKDFLDLFDQWTSLNSEVKGLKDTIGSREERIAEIEETLANPKPDMLPPQIYQNKVVIYPVKE